MTNEAIFPPLHNWEPTRRTLQLYSRVVGVVPRAHGEFHPRWWHISLKVHSDGLATDEIALPNNHTLRLKFDLRRHVLVITSSEGDPREFSLAEGLSANAFGDQVLGAIADYGLSGEYAIEKFAGEEDADDPCAYNPDAVARFLTALTNADRIFKDHRATLSGETGPVQLWPHGFDLAFEWFGTRVERYEEDGEVQLYPSQINLGFYPGQPAPYFYCNPWPFEADVLLDKPLPAGARWHTEGWQGTILPYEELVDDSSAEQRLREYARVVFEHSSPTLLT